MKMVTQSRMYEERVKSINFFVGCYHGCKYCIPSFQRQTKRRGKHCKLCYHYLPHPHLERLKRAPPRTRGDEFIFFPSNSDWVYIPKDVGDEAIAYMERYPDRNFLCQTKNPSCFYQFNWPHNAILAITLETDSGVLTAEVSDAPTPLFRFAQFEKHPHPRKIITVEPVLDFGVRFQVMLERIYPRLEALYIGYDNHSCELNEPRLRKVIDLIRYLEPSCSPQDVRTGARIGKIRCKTIRKAWFEP